MSLSGPASHYNLHHDHLNNINIIPDLLLALPISVLLPTIGFNTDFKRRKGRSGREESEAGRQEQPAHPLLERIDLLFSSLDLEDEDCKQRAICEIVQNKMIYSPLSELLISIFR